MTRSLHSRLIAGMLLGMALLLAAAGTAIYAIQRRQLHRAFDETLLSSANAIASLIHPGPFGNWFDFEKLERLPAGRIREGAFFQIWSDHSLDVPLPRSGPDSQPGPVGSVGRPAEDQSPPEPPPPPPARPAPLRPGDDEPPGSPYVDPDRRPEPLPRPPRGRRDARTEQGLDPTERGPGVVRSPRLGGSDLPRLDPPDNQPRFADIRLPDGSPGRAVGVRFRLPTRGPGPRMAPLANLTVVVAASTTEIERQVQLLAGVLAGTAVGTMAVAAGVASLIVRRGLRPLGRLAQRIGAMRETDLKQRLALAGVPPELEPVVNQLNGLLARLDAAFDRERALTADVAHELRTPVAELRAVTEITLQRPRDPAEYNQALAEILQTVTTLQGLIERLLILARLEAGQVQPELTPVPLQPALLQRWAQFREAAAARDVTFEDQCPAEAAVRADPGLLDVVLSNALCNAAAYTPRGGRIRATMERDGARFRLCLTNPGCTLRPDEVEKVFERFWRADPARRTSGLNCGLGLTLVRRAMEAMGGQATAYVSEDRCFVLVLSFPAADDPAESSADAGAEP